MKTIRTPKDRRSKLEQSLRDQAAKSWRYCREFGLDIWGSHFGGKFIAFRLAAEAISLNQHNEEILSKYDTNTTNFKSYARAR